jgi:hypothetical protein
MSSGTGISASGNAIANGAGPSPAANDCAASMPSATNAHAAAAAMPTMKATGVRPGARPARTASGSNGSVMCGSILRVPTGWPCTSNVADWSRPDAPFGLDQRYGEPCENGLPRTFYRKRIGISFSYVAWWP